MQSTPLSLPPAVEPAVDPAKFFREVDVAEALAALSAADGRLGSVIDAAGVLPRLASFQEARAARHEPNRAFRSLARAIVFQQLNGAAAATIFGRFKAAVGAEDDDAALTPTAVAAADTQLMQSCGLSQRKVDYLKVRVGLLGVVVLVERI